MNLLILDRDGVINQDSDDYIRSAEQWQPIPGSIEAIAQLCQAGFEIAIATNQSGLGRGYFDLEALEAMHEKLRLLVEEAGGSIACIAYCPHTPDEGCDCRKPGTGLLRTIEAELDTSVSGAWFIGDSLKDLQAAEHAQCRPMLVTTGKGQGTLSQLQQDVSGDTLGLDKPSAIPVHRDLAAAAAAIIAQHQAS
ncbi:D-glycero-beta-D-manno-heptose 1,7-bisphosphate 7-phosphatase [Parahaliea sp. F7430]|uniref:D,D-heptose 1,7-bisphosphate phosphatase n=1 Tax=Sediminihaliea albiluteola TaxID=2758564 RepID=A0A7W2TXU0_9GAMM|nr:D-glycero-beta-D-manno-heptose 1,7-bisphosphate 7-phosphatase [Sediminihaliea albiluteola]MBA6413789.1 D-glycero-beta-D-manno-heptose 1,7-bisphosphate 7-phosphatase [Sediminihaliea albiluteola]